MFCSRLDLWQRAVAMFEKARWKHIMPPHTFSELIVNHFSLTSEKCTNWMCYSQLITVRYILTHWTLSREQPSLTYMYKLYTKRRRAVKNLCVRSTFVKTLRGSFQTLVALSCDFYSFGKLLEVRTGKNLLASGISIPSCHELSWFYEWCRGAKSNNSSFYHCCICVQL